MNPSDSRYALETRVVTVIKILSRYKANEVTKQITGTEE